MVDLELANMDEVLPEKEYILWGMCRTHSYVSGNVRYQDAQMDWNIIEQTHSRVCGHSYNWLVIWERSTKKVVFPIDYSGLAIGQVREAAKLTGEERLKRQGNTPIKAVRKAKPKVKP